MFSCQKCLSIALYDIIVLPCSDMQFGFKKKMGCSHAIFALHQCVDYFVKTGSSVFMAAFDRVNHTKLFRRLLDKGMPRICSQTYCQLVL